MSQISLNYFRIVAHGNSDTDRVVVDSKQSQGVCMDRQLTLWTEPPGSRWTENYQNRTAREVFQKVMKATFGTSAALVNINNKPLSSREIRQKLTTSDTKLTTLIKKNLGLSKTNTLPHALDKLTARWRYAQTLPSFSSDTPSSPSSTSPNSSSSSSSSSSLFTRILEAYTNSGAKELDDEAHKILSANPPDARVRLAEKVLKTATTGMDKERAAIYKNFLRTAVLNLTNTTKDNKALLVSLGKTLARQLDDVVGTAVKSIIGPGKFYAKMSNLPSSPADLFSQFPGLLDVLETETVFFVRNIQTFVNRLAADRGDIQKTFNITSDMSLTDIQVTNSDPHNKGQRVMIASFGQESNNKKLVYKPRDCRVDQRIIGSGTEDKGDPISLAGLLNKYIPSRKDALPAIPTCKFLTKEMKNQHYAYMQFLPHQNQVNEEEEVQNYYEDMGRLTALAALCGVTDLHHGNFIVSGKRPYVTDLEMAFSHSVFTQLPNSQISPPPVPHPNIYATGIPGQALQSNTENVFYLGVPCPSPTQNFIKFKGNKPCPQDYTKYLYNGFQSVYSAVMDNKSEVINFLKSHFNGLHTRFHPMETFEQQCLRQNKILSPDKPMSYFKTKNDESNGFSLDAVYKKASGADYKTIIEMARKDWQVGDVAYFTRTLAITGTGSFFHNGKKVENEKSQSFVFNGLERAIKYVNTFPIGSTSQGSKKFITDALKGIPLFQGSVTK